MQTHNLGYPRIGSHRELKKASEQYWSGKISVLELLKTGREIRFQNWKLQKEAGIEIIPSNDFSYYDQVLDMSLAVGAIPQRYNRLLLDNSKTELDLYFAMARGYQKDDIDITAMEMTKWFNTNYHYLVPEFYKNQEFRLFPSKIINEFLEAKEAGIKTKPVLLGPISFLLLGKEKEEGFDRIDLIQNLLPRYIELLKKLREYQVEWIQFDEPYLAMDLTQKDKEAFIYAYRMIKKEVPALKTLLATYFEGLEENLSLAVSLPVCCLHIDMVSCPEQLDEVLDVLPEKLSLSLGLVDGRNIWKNDFQESLDLIKKASSKIGEERLMIAPSCSLLHVPCDLDLETKEDNLTPQIKQWLAFAKQKIEEVVSLNELAKDKPGLKLEKKLKENQTAIASRRKSPLIHNEKVKERVKGIRPAHSCRQSVFNDRLHQQKEKLNLPLFPTTTIGSFPQTKEVRSWRSEFKKGEISQTRYQNLLKDEIKKTIKWQEEIGLDVLVHGEAERNDMVEYFGEKLEGFAFTTKGWVQSYGSRCVKPPIIFGDVHRPDPMTVDWIKYAQGLSNQLVKGMLTGPVTILQWSFVRNDQSPSKTCNQIALAIREEVNSLEAAGVKIIQIDEPALREGLPLRKKDWKPYLEWAVKAFKISSTGVEDSTQIHTHMCYSEFNDIIEDIAAMDADVITIECSRSQMELLDAFGDFQYPNEIGPGVYDIHSPRIPSKEEMMNLLEKALKVIPAERLWVNPDCGLKTRDWKETKEALINMVSASKEMRKKFRFSLIH